MALYILLLSWITFGIYGVYLIYKRMSRVDGFVRRKRAYYDAVLDYTEKYAQEKNQYSAVQSQIAGLRGVIDERAQNSLKEIGANLHIVLTIVTFGLWGIYVLYRLNKAWNDLQTVEQEFTDGLNPIWQTLGLAKYPLSFTTDPKKQRSFGLYLLLSIVTLGIVGLVWDYKIHTDPENLYLEFHALEDTVLQTVRQYAPAS